MPSEKKAFLLNLGERTSDATTDEMVHEAISRKKVSEIERREELAEAEHKAKMASYRKQEATAEAAAERTETGGGPGGGPFTVTGKVNLGEFDLQKNAQEAQAAASAAIDKANENAARAEERARAAEERAHQTEMESLKETFSNQLGQLQQQVAAGMNQKSFVQQYNEVMETAKQLGASFGPEVGGSAASSLETLKLQQQMNREEREFKRQMRQEDREWDLRIQKLNDDRDFRLAELNVKRERDQMLVNAPKVVGEAIGRALVEYGNQKEGAIAEEPAAAAGQSSAFHIEAGQGDTGTADCPVPGCNGKIGVGPTTTMATCAACGTRIPVHRVGAARVPANAGRERGNEELDEDAG